MKIEQETAASIQLHMLPATLPGITGYDISAASRIAEKAGGDFYDIIPLDDSNTLIMIGDTSGKEMTAVLYMNATISILYALVYRLKYSENNYSSLSLLYILEILNDILRIKTGRGHFVTVFIGILNTKMHYLRYTTSGHNPVILYNPGTGKYGELRTNGQLCGIVKTELYKETLEEKIQRIEPGDCLIFYTNGITEAQNKHKELYKRRYYENIHQIKSHMPAKDIISFLLKGVENFTDKIPQNDDITLICLKRMEKDIKMNHQMKKEEKGDIVNKDEDMSISIDSVDNDILILYCSGVFNINTSNNMTKIFDELTKHYKSKFYIIKCEDIEYISNSGIGVFMDLFERVNTQSGKICFIGMNNYNKELFDLMCFSRYFGFVDTLDAAYSYIGK